MTDSRMTIDRRRVELWGGQVPVTELAARSGSSAYALLCGLKRVPRSYLDA